MKGSGFGFWVDMLLGIAGAMVGGFIAGHLGFAASGGMIYTLVIAILGAILIVFLFRLITGETADAGSTRLDSAALAMRAAEPIFLAWQSHV